MFQEDSHVENKESLLATVKEANNIYKEEQKKVFKARRMKEDALKILGDAEDSQKKAAKRLEEAFECLRKSNIKTLKDSI